MNKLIATPVDRITIIKFYAEMESYLHIIKMLIKIDDIPYLQGMFPNIQKFVADARGIKTDYLSHLLNELIDNVEDKEFCYKLIGYIDKQLHLIKRSASHDKKSRSV